MYAVGDVVFGKSFPADDGRGDRGHYAVVIGFRHGVAFAVMGTSLKIAEEMIRKRPALLVVSPTIAAQHWRETGLSKPTLFDLEWGTRLALSASNVEQWGVSAVGNLKNVGAWRRLLKLCG